MSNFKKLLSMVLALAMICSTFAIGAQAAYAEYKDENITGYDSIDQPVFTSAQLASIALDAVDAMLADIDDPIFKIPILNVNVNLSGIDALLESIEPIYNGAVWNTVLNIAGELGKELNFSALYYADSDDGFDSPNFSANGCRRSTPGKTDLDVIYSLFQFIYDNTPLLAKYGYGTLDLGATLTGLLESMLPEINAYLDAPNLIRGLLYDLVYDPSDENGYKDWEDMTDAEKASDLYKADAMVQLLVDDLMVDLEKSLAKSFGWGITMNLSGILDIDAPNFYDVFETALQQAYQEILVPLGNTQFKKFFYELAGVKDFSAYRISDANDKTIGYYLDDCADILKLKTSEYNFPTGNSLAEDVAAGNVKLNILGEMVNLDYEIQDFDFASSDTQEFISEFNNVLGTWVTQISKFDTTWNNGTLDELIPNVMAILKEFVRQYGEKYLSDYITLPTDDAELEALLAELNGLEDIVVKFGPELIEQFAPNMMLPENLTSVRAILSYALCELIADKVPEEDIYSKLQSGAIDPNSDDGWQAIVAVIARYYLNALINVDLPAGLTFEQTVTALVDWALTNYGGILDYAADLSANTSLSAWEKLDEVIFGLIPISWLPETCRVLDASGNETTVKLEDGSRVILLDVILGNVLDLKFEYIFDLFKRNSSGDLNNSPIAVILGFVRNVLNNIIPGAIRDPLPTIESLLTKTALGNLINDLLSGLYEIRTNLIPAALPLVCMILELTTEQQIEDPDVIYPSYIYSSALSFNGTSIVVRNSSTGVNTAWTDASGTVHQDALYKVRIKSITTDNSAVSVTYNANETLNGGDSKSFPVTGTVQNEGLVTFTVAYEILDESGSSLTTSPIEVNIFTYMSKTNSDDDSDNYETDASGYNYYVDGFGMNNHFYVNAPVGYINSWGSLSGQSYEIGRDTTEDAYNPLDAAVTLKSFATTVPGDILSAPAWENITTKQAGYIRSSKDYLTLTIPQVASENDPEVMVDQAFADYVEQVGNGSQYTVSVTNTFGPTEEGDVSTDYTFTRTLVFYNDYNLYGLVNSAMDANRQKDNYSSTSAWNAYLSALKAAQAIVLAPKTLSTFDASVFAPAAEALESAIEALDETAVSAGVASLEALREQYQPSNEEGVEYDDPAYNYMGSEDYVLYTWDRYKEHRSNMDSLINSQYVAEPGEDATAEELAAYEEALANIPTLKQFDITYRGHMYQMNADRLVRRASSKNYLTHAYRLVSGKAAALEETEYTAASWEALERALAFAETVLADTSSDLRQTKINKARQMVIECYKGLEIKGSDPADYAQLDAAIAQADEIFNTEDYENLYTGLEDLLPVYEAAKAIARDLLVDDQAIVDEAAQALLDVLALVEKVAAALDFSPAESVIADYGYDWAPEVKDGFGDLGDFKFIDGLMIEYYDGIESLVATTGGAEYVYTPNDNSSGAIGTGDTIEFEGEVYYIIVYGDTNGDGMIELQDVSDFAAIASYELYDESGILNFAADMNGDQVVEITDVSIAEDIASYTLDPYSFPQNGSFVG